MKVLLPLQLTDPDAVMVPPGPALEVMLKGPADMKLAIRVRLAVNIIEVEASVLYVLPEEVVHLSNTKQPPGVAVAEKYTVEPEGKDPAPETLPAPGGETLRVSV